jgi:endonuclease/exonuclease/phosphatase (EEP) superfamily protein YafD
VLGVAAWAGARALGVERGQRPVQLVSFTPYVAAASLAPLALALGRRRWVAAGTAALAAAALAGCVLPRAFASSAGTASAAADGPHLRVMTSNLLVGGADAAAVTRLVTRYRIDVLAVQELTEDGERALEVAGIGALLPHRLTNSEPGAAGTGLYTRLEVRDWSAHKLAASGFVQTAATLAVPGAAPVLVESVHPCAPVDPGRDTVWRSDLADQRAATPDGPVRILLGDFNATLDHAALRRLLAGGYRDAAAVVGAGLVPTWPNDGRLVPGVTLDHVLADRRVGVRAVSVHDVARSDHRAVVADLVLPAGH